jgi:chemotaxis protein MotB
MARRKRRAEHVNHDRWLVSYADFVTLLFAFFVVMYSISSVNEEKYKIFSDSLSVAFSSWPSPSLALHETKSRDFSASQNIAFPNQPNSAYTTMVPSEDEHLLKALVDRRTARLGEQQRKIQDRMRYLEGGLKRVMSPLISRHLVNISITRRGVVVDISASTLFKTGEAELQPGARDVLRQVSVVLKSEQLPIEVEGHTDDIPITTAQFPSNWELSSARASSVVRMMIDEGVAEKRLAVVGLASNQPLVPNDSPENRARNRRVSITIVAPNLERVTAGGE